MQTFHDEWSKSAIEILSKCTFSKLNTKSIDDPFFKPTYDSVTIYEILKNPKHNLPDKDITTMKNIANKIELPETLLRMYLLLDSNQREFAYNIFVFLPISELEQRFNMFQQNNQPDVCDLATSYYGLGHIIVLSWNRQTNSFMLRRDGGSNDYDRRDNMNFIRQYKAKTTPLSKQIKMNDLFKTLSKKNVEDLRDLFINK